MNKALINFSLLFGLIGMNALAAEDGTKTIATKPCVTVTGADSHVSDRGYYRVQSIDDWTKIWQQHKGHKSDVKYDSYYDPLGLPLVDFDHYMVIAIFQGSSWNSAGLMAKSVSEKEDRITFRFDDKSYQTMSVGSESDGGGKKVTAYGFFVIPRSTKAVVLEENVQGLIGKPPIWKERIKFEEVRDK